MFLILGWAIVLASVVGGFLMVGGHLAALIQPSEMIIIGGAATGAFMASNSPKKIKKIAKSLGKSFSGSKHTPEAYMQVLVLLFEIIQKQKKEGVVALEADVENPGASPLFKRYPAISQFPVALTFLCDYLRLIISGNMDPVELEALMDHEITTAKHELGGPGSQIQKLADALPAFGIVAAVMGVVHVMGSVGKVSNAELGQMIAAALVGTFLGILLSYGFVGPVASTMEQRTDDEIKMLECIKVVLLASLHQYAGPICVEFGRKVLYSSERPDFAALEAAIKKAKSNR
jgi:chemotaxis protein MotA